MEDAEPTAPPDPNPRFPFAVQLRVEAALRDKPELAPLALHWDGTVVRPRGSVHIVDYDVLLREARLAGDNARVRAREGVRAKGGAELTGRLCAVCVACWGG